MFHSPSSNDGVETLKARQAKSGAPIKPLGAGICDTPALRMLVRASPSWAICVGGAYLCGYDSKQTCFDMLVGYSRRDLGARILTFGVSEPISKARAQGVARSASPFRPSI